MKFNLNNKLRKFIFLSFLFSFTLAFSQAPNKPTTSTGNTTNGCNTSRKLSVTSPDAGYPSTITHKWYTTEFGTQTTSHTVVDPGFQSTMYITEKTMTQSGTYWVAARRNGQESARTKVQVTFTTPDTSPPTLVLGTNTPPCGPTAIFNLGAGGGGSGSSYKWYDTSNTTGTPIHEGVSYNPSLNYNSMQSGKTYWVKATLTSTNCYSGSKTETKSIVINFKAPVPTPNTNDVVNCGSTSFNLTATGAPNGATYRWYDSNDNVLQTNISNSYITGTLTASKSYKVSILVDGCEGSKTPLTATIKSVPNVPTFDNNNIVQPTCANSKGSFIISNYDSSYTYSISASGATMNGAVITASAGTYKVKSIKNGCESGYSVNVIIQNQPITPDKPEISSVTQPTCNNPLGSFTIENFNGDYNYIISPSTDVTRINNLIKAPMGIYTVMATLGSCNSNVSDSSTVNLQPATPDAPEPNNNGSRCGPGEMVLTAQSVYPTAEYRWYDQYGNRVPNASTSTLNIGSITESTTYEVSVYYNGCESNRADVIGTVDTKPNAPAPLHKSRCGAGSITIYASGFNEGEYKWYAPNGSIIPNQNSSFLFIDNLLETATYQVSGYDGCESNKTNVTATVNPAMGQPDVEGASSCGPGSLTLKATGSPNNQYRWYNSDGSPISGNNTNSLTTDNLIDSKTYKVSIYEGPNCEGPTKDVTATIIQIPSSPTVTSDSNCGPGQVQFIASGSPSGYYRWYNPNGTLIPNNNTNTLTISNLTSTATYQVSSIVDGCEGDKSNAVGTIYPLLNPPSGTDTFQVCGQNTVDISLTPDSNGNVVRWYTSSSGGTHFSVGTVTVSTGTYYASSYNSVTGCESNSRREITVNTVAEVTWYPDNDNDTFADTTDSNQSVIDCSEPIGNWTSNSELDLCPDYYSATNQGPITWYLDVDGDGHSVSSIINCGSPGANYVTTVLGTNDCDDTNDQVYQAKIWYDDADNDGLGDPNTPSSYLCSPPAGYVANSNDLCPGVTSETNDCEGTSYNDSSDQNYIYTRNYQEPWPGSTPASKFINDDNYIQDITYFDGLGRAMQQTAIRQAPDKKDIVSHIGYDGYGRQEKEWLPFHDPIEPLGQYRTGDMKYATQQYYNVNYNDDFVGLSVENTNAYAEKDFDNSPLNRVVKQANPGKDWKLIKNGDDHAVEMVYTSNGTSEVRRFNVTLAFANKTYSPTLTESSSYVAGELSKVIMKDENHTGSTKNHTTEEFKDKQGRVILKRTYADVPGQTQATHDTYYVYDDYGNLSYVLPPLMNAHTEVLSTLISNLPALGYQYTYDHRNRLVEKQVPGKKKEYMIYNNLNQPIMTQDPNQRNKIPNKEWLFTKYDAFGRVAYTGLATDNRERWEIQAEVNSFTGDLWVNKGTAAATIGDTGGIYYNNGAYPNDASGTTINEILTISYYDNYDLIDKPTGAPASIIVLDNAPQTNTLSVKGLPTVSKVRVLDTDVWINSISYYDDKARAVYNYTENEYLQTIDIAELSLDFVGKPIKTKTTHIRDNTSIVTIDNFTYDHVGRLLSQTQCIGDETLGNSCEGAGGGTVDSNLQLTGTINTPQAASVSITVTEGEIVDGGHLYISNNAPGIGADEELIVLNTYDNLGQLVNKKVGGDVANTVSQSTGLQQVSYAYNVLGWLKTINEPGNLGNQLFGFAMKHNDAADPTKRLFNGNISETAWKTQSPVTSANSISESYVYGYDALNRIINAQDNTGHYDLTKVLYDKNGNITELERKGHIVNMPTTAADFNVMDDLVYTYIGNQLQKVDDNSFIDTGFFDGNDTAQDFMYDDNGNMTLDANKGISNISYNYLNLPTKVIFSNNGKNGTIDYIYDATGGKQKKIATNNVESSVTITEYAGGYIYEGGVNNTQLQFFAQPEGYVKADNGQYGYVYQYVDHLGNVRLSYAEDPVDGSLEIVEENNYYPFGLKHKGYNGDTSTLGNDAAQRWKFGGKEYQEDMDLDWYDVSARNYDPALGRWMNLDPLAEKMRRHSPYNYAFDNPIYFMDPDGMAPQGNSDGYGSISPTSSSYQGGSSQYEVEDENGNKTKMNSDQLTDYITANGITDDFTINGSRISSANGKDKGSSPSSGGCVTGDCYAAYFGAKAKKMDAEIKQYKTHTENNSNGNKHQSNNLGYAFVISGSLYSVGEFLIDNQTWGYWLDSKGKFRSYSLVEKAANGKYLRGVQGYRYGIQYAQKYAGYWKVAGRFTFYGGAIISGFEGIGHLQNGNFEGVTRSAMDVAMGRVSLLGPWGALAGGSYYLGTWAADNGYIRQSEYKPDWNKTCFVAGTKIIMNDGTEKNIENVKTGDSILSVDTDKMRVEVDIVNNVTKFPKKKIIKMILQNDIEIEFTEEHPFWVVGKGWSVFNKNKNKNISNLKLSKLEVGDIVLMYSENQLNEIQIIKLYDTKVIKDVYNLHDVDNNSNFFANKILVHNKVDN